MHFLKLEALGNDYVYVNADEIKGYDLINLTKKISERRTGIGADGLIAVQKITDQAIRMTMLNADGSEGAMCGNGVRGAVFFAIKELGIKNNKVKVITKSRNVLVKLESVDFSDTSNLKGLFATADMGEVKSGKNPAVLAEELSKVGLYVDKRQILHVNVGNPHLVFFEPNYSLSHICRAVIRSGLFPDGINVERVFKINNLNENESRLFMEVSERGAGKTLSCGSGAVAIALAYTRFNNNDCFRKKINVCTEGGILSVNFEGKNALLSGEINEIYRGEIDEI